MEFHLLNIEIAKEIMTKRITRSSSKRRSNPRRKLAPFGVCDYLVSFGGVGGGAGGGYCCCCCCCCCYI